MHRFTAAVAIFLLTGCSSKPADSLTDEQALATANLQGGDDPFLDQANNEGEQNNVTANSLAPPAPTDADPVVYQALGTQPGWTLAIRASRLDYTADNGSIQITDTTPSDFHPTHGSWQTNHLQILISRGPCNDGTSNRTYRDTVNLIVDGQDMKGCGGGMIASDSINETNWTVVAVNGQSAPTTPDYFLRFSKGILLARFGCNRINGPFTQNGDRIVAADLQQTLMACPDPAAGFERDASAVLSGAAHIEFIGRDRMRLIGDAGSIELRRSDQAAQGQLNAPVRNP